MSECVYYLICLKGAHPYHRHCQNIWPKDLHPPFSLFFHLLVLTRCIWCWQSSAPPTVSAVTLLSSTTSLSRQSSSSLIWSYASLSMLSGDGGDYYIFLNKCWWYNESWWCIKPPCDILEYFLFFLKSLLLLKTVRSTAFGFFSCFFFHDFWQYCTISVNRNMLIVIISTCFYCESNIMSL